MVEDCLIDGNFAGGARGISDERTGGGELYVSNTTVRNTGMFGIAISSAVAGQRIDAAFDNMRVQNTNNIGIIIGNNGRVMINRSVITGNFQIGIGVTGLQAPAEVNISNSVVSNNGLGIGNLSGTVTSGCPTTTSPSTTRRFFGVDPVPRQQPRPGQRLCPRSVAPTPIGLQ